MKREDETWLFYGKQEIRGGEVKSRSQFGKCHRVVAVDHDGRSFIAVVRHLKLLREGAAQ